MNTQAAHFCDARGFKVNILRRRSFKMQSCASALGSSAHSPNTTDLPRWFEAVITSKYLSSGLSYSVYSH